MQFGDRCTGREHAVDDCRTEQGDGTGTARLMQSNEARSYDRGYLAWSGLAAGHLVGCRYGPCGMQAVLPVSQSQ